MSTRYFLSAVPDGIKTQKVLFKNLPNKVVVIDPKEVDEADAEFAAKLRPATHLVIVSQGRQ